MTESEALFEQFCRANSIPCSRVEEGETRTPDYDVYFDGHLVISEIKQFEPNDSDKELRRLAHTRKAAAGWEVSDRRVRAKIDAASEQLKARSQGQYPAILVLYDNVPTKPVDENDIKTAMYGRESVTLLVPNGPEDASIMIEHAGFGSDRRFTPSHNTTISAVALLFESGGAIHFSVFHNIHAKHPIDPAWLRRDSVRHFVPGPQVEGAFQEWVEV